MTWPRPTKFLTVSNITQGWFTPAVLYATKHNEPIGITHNNVPIGIIAPYPAFGAPIPTLEVRDDIPFKEITQ